jgi:hypothetical protein
VLAGVVTLLLDRALSGSNAFVQLAVAGTTGLLVYLATAIPRKDLRVWIAAVRSTKAPLNPAAG